MKSPSYYILLMSRFPWLIPIYLALIILSGLFYILVFLIRRVILPFIRMGKSVGQKLEDGDDENTPCASGPSVPDCNNNLDTEL